MKTGPEMVILACEEVSNLCRLPSWTLKECKGTHLLSRMRFMNFIPQNETVRKVDLIGLKSGWGKSSHH
jgi:hypothetical protein